MGSFDRSKKRIHVWKKAALHLLLCFVMGFFTGFAPTNTASLFSGQSVVTYRPVKDLGISPEPVEALPQTVVLGSFNRSLVSTVPVETPTITTAATLTGEGDTDDSGASQLIIIITTTRSGDQLQGPFLLRLANTLKLVSPPLLWIVVEAHSDAPKTAELLRNTGIMYRHLTFKENFTDPDVEADHQRNVALNHIEYHRLNGIVHFAGMSNTYDLRFFEEIRDIEVFGTWPVAMVSLNGQRVVVEGPVCSSSKVVGWQWNDISNGSTYSRTNMETNNGTTDVKSSTINISGFAFNSSILWDPERWGRPSSVPDNSQDSIKFVQQVVLEDETKLRPIPPDCTRIMAWQLNVQNGESIAGDREMET